ncbi:MAG: hypothetical protein HYT72_02165 [Candidatus Aenigmarchaeota archaeon]|nr:hypothetical protein [Candidatus Aenigmarchaeota archaeon]
MENKRILDKVLLDFLIGGALVSLAIFIGILTSPLIGGIIAALPIRVGITILLGGFHEGEEFAKKMIEGSLLTYVPTLFFFLTLYFTADKIGLLKSFVLASFVTLISLIIVFKLAGKF